MITNQAYLFLIFVMNGLLIGFLFDVFRILRISFKTKDFVTYIEDILFWLITGAIILYSIFKFNNGEIRFYMFLGIAIGVILYIMLFSKYIIQFNVKAIKIIKQTLRKIIQVIYIPISFVGKLIKRIFFKPISFITINLEKFSTKFVKKINNKTKIIKKKTTLRPKTKIKKLNRQKSAKITK